jgi:hypothetical protein
MADSKSSKSSPRSKPDRSGRIGPALAAFALLTALSAAAAWWFHANGYTLYYGDAQAHESIARRILDSRTPGYEQIGTVWLPLPHALTLPFIRNEWLWRNGLAGVIPSAAFFVLGGAFLFSAVRRLTASAAAGGAAASLMAFNPNLLYLQSTPMTETIFLGALLGVLYFTVLFAQTRRLIAALGAGFCLLLASLTRYEGWFLIPFAALYLLLSGEKKRVSATVLLLVIAGAGPAYWLAHNAYFYSNPLEFYNGPYSAKAIYQRALDHGLEKYPGDHDLARAFQQYKAAARLCAGLPLLVLGAGGLLVCMLRRVWWPPLLLLLVPAFYVWSIYGSGTPVFVPNLWPNSYYNTRYAVAVIPLAALAGGLLVTAAPQGLRKAFAVLLVLAGVSPWIAYPRMDGWVCWKESQVNSEARRAWTAEATEFLKENYKGGGILASFGDLTGIFREAGIPLRHILHEGNDPPFRAALHRPDMFLLQRWVVALDGDAVSAAMAKTELRGPRFRCAKIVEVKGAPALRIWERERP